MNFFPFSPSPSAFLSRENIVRQIIFFDKTVRPRPPLSAHPSPKTMSRMLKERQQQIEWFRGERRNNFAVAQQQTLP